MSSCLRRAEMRGESSPTLLPTAYWSRSVNADVRKDCSWLKRESHFGIAVVMTMSLSLFLTRRQSGLNQRKGIGRH